MPINPLVGSNIGADGKRYPSGQAPTRADVYVPARVYGTQVDGQVPKWSAARGRLEWADDDGTEAGSVRTLHLDIDASDPAWDPFDGVTGATVVAFLNVTDLTEPSGPWQPNHNYDPIAPWSSQIIGPVDVGGGDMRYFAADTGGGTSGVSEPDWTTAPNQDDATAADGTISTWVNIGANAPTGHPTLTLVSTPADGSVLIITRAATADPFSIVLPGVGEMSAITSGQVVYNADNDRWLKIANPVGD